MQKGCVNRQIARLPITITKFPFRFMKKFKKTWPIFAVALNDVDPRLDLRPYRPRRPHRRPQVGTRFILTSVSSYEVHKPSYSRKTFFHFHFCFCRGLFLPDYFGSLSDHRSTAGPPVDHHFVTRYVL